MNTHVRDGRSHVRHFIEITPELRGLLEAIAAAAIDALDQIDGDADSEPSLGWNFSCLSLGGTDDREEQCDDEGEDGGDREPWLGWHDETGSHGGTWLSRDGLEG